jgi:DNA-binding transcriptional MocR family regulator
MTATLERRKEVLRLAHEHNFLVLEGGHVSFVFRGLTHYFAHR